jgi:hypothetical protein
MLTRYCKWETVSGVSGGCSNASIDHTVCRLKLRHTQAWWATYREVLKDDPNLKVRLTCSSLSLVKVKPVTQPVALQADENLRYSET